MIAQKGEFEPAPGATIDDSAYEGQRTSVVQMQRVERRGRQIVEYLLKDAMENFYLVYRATLQDGEVRQWPGEPRDAWVKPSQVVAMGGFSDALFEDWRGRAFDAFDRTARLIQEARNRWH
jgi:hypothetical protein